MIINIIIFGICFIFIIFYYFHDSVIINLKKIYISNGILKCENTYNGHSSYKIFSKKTLLRKLNNFSEEELLQLRVDLKKLCKNKSELISKLYFENELINLTDLCYFRKITL